MVFFVGLLLVGLGLAGCAIALMIHRKNAWVWLPSWINYKPARNETGGPTHLIFCFVDHFEPMWERPSYEKEVERVDRWVTQYPKMAGNHLDADGFHPKHSFFYPIEEYRPEHLEKLRVLCAQGFGEVEIHLHHENDTSENLCTTLRDFADLLHREHGFLPIDPKTGKPSYSFIHGNWSLDNSHPHGDWCGVNDEITVLQQTGCYADFTLPSAPSPCQTSQVNSIYYAIDNPLHPKSHNTGSPVAVGKAMPDKGLMLIQGPLALNWKWRKFGLIPRIENSDVRRTSPPIRERIDCWVNQGISVAGRPEWVFVKIHTHGTQESDHDVLLGASADLMYTHLEKHYNDGKNFVLHYVTAREMYNIAKAAEAGLADNPNAYRDFVLPKPTFQKSAEATCAL